MHKKSKAERLAALSHLWTSGEWTLHKHHHSRARIVFVFSAGQPSAQELLAIRALVPRFTEAPISALKAEVGSLSEFVVDEFDNLEARSLESKAQVLGLTVRREDTSFTSYLRVNIHGSASIIEDNELAALVNEEMLRHGVPVVSHAEHD
jgi:hypothetical protein